MTLRRVLWILLALLVLGPLTLFWWQNSATRVNLLFSLGGGLAWDLGPQGLPLPLLLVAAVGIGGLFSASVLGLRGLKKGRHNRSLERQVSVLQEELDFARRQMREAAAESGTSSSRSAPSGAGVDSRTEEDSRSFDDLI